jgi:hypothetical protein
MESDFLELPPQSKPASETRGLEEAVIAAKFSEIEAILAAGRILAAREACADLLFKFQPVFASDTRLYTRFLAVLERTKARRLKQRLVVAVSGVSDDHDNGWSR